MLEDGWSIAEEKTFGLICSYFSWGAIGIEASWILFESSLIVKKIAFLVWELEVCRQSPVFTTVKLGRNSVGIIFWLLLPHRFKERRGGAINVKLGCIKVDGDKNSLISLRPNSSLPFLLLLLLLLVLCPFQFRRGKEEEEEEEGEEGGFASWLPVAATAREKKDAMCGIWQTLLYKLFFLENRCQISWLWSSKASWGFKHLAILFS